MRNYFRIGILLASLSIGNLGFTQQFAENSPPLMNQFPYFNSSVIKANNVKSLSTSVMYKIPNRKLYHSSEKELFLFDENGNVSKVEITNRAYVTSSTNYFLNVDNQLITEHIKVGIVSQFRSFEYNKEGLVTQVLLANANTAKTITKEEFKYEYFSENQYKKYWLNDEGLTYKYTVVDIDEQGRKEEERTRYIRGASRETNYYGYENNRLVSYSHNEKEFTRREVKYRINHNEKGDVLDMNKSVDGAFVTRFEYLYEDGLLIAILQKNIRTQEIRITKVKYEFYNE